MFAAAARAEGQALSVTNAGEVLLKKPQQLNYQSVSHVPALLIYYYDVGKLPFVAEDFVCWPAAGSRYSRGCSVSSVCRTRS